jgi:hypothetical protein
MQLEQLIGSNSFGSAVKAPLLLRRLDLLTLALFAVWCLSPLGSQGLLRCYNKQTSTKNDTPVVKYLNTVGSNSMFSSKTGSELNIRDAYRLQLLSTYYSASFLPISEAETASWQANYDQDLYDNPMAKLLPDDNNNNPVVPGKYAGAYGIAINLPTPAFKTYSPTAVPPDGYNEQVSFTMAASYFNFTCGNWTLKLFEEVKSLVNLDQTNEIGLSVGNQTDPNYLAFASYNRIPSTNATYNPNATWEYSFIECTFDRVFANYDVSCDRTTPLSTDAEADLTASCGVESPTRVSDPNPASSQNDTFRDFSNDWMDSISSGGGYSIFPITASKSFPNSPKKKKRGKALPISLHTDPF